MAIINGYTTLTNLKAKLGKLNSNIQDSFLEDCITRASRIIDIYTGCYFYSKAITSEYVDYFTFSSNGFFILNTDLYCPAPIITLTSIYEDNILLVENTDYYVYSNKISKDTSWTSSRKGIKITGTFGYATTPQDIEQVCISLASAISGLDTRLLVDDAGNTVEVEGFKIPATLFNLLKMRRALNV